jgi:hypothetical protein
MKRGKRPEWMKMRDAVRCNANANAQIDGRVLECDRDDEDVS